jgi:hypothetical protein
MRPSGKAWIGLAAGVAAYDALCPRGETLSEGIDAALERPIGRYLAIGAVAVTSAHLLNILPNKIDPIQRFVQLLPGKEYQI